MRYFILLTQNSLVVFSKNGAPQQFLFPQEAVKHQEIVNQKLFETFLADVAHQLPKDETILFLSDELIFIKTIPLTKELNLEEETQHFTDSVPFQPETIEKKSFQEGSNVVFFAMNSSLYKTIAAAAQKNNRTIKSVVPLSLFGSAIDKTQLSYKQLESFAKKTATIKKGDLMQMSKPTVERKAPLKQLLLLLVCLLVLGGVIAWAVTATGLFPSTNPTKNNSNTAPSPSKAASQPTITTQTSPQSNESATADKSSLKIQILNGSGVAGLAGRVNTALTDTGFANAQTGNASTSDIQTTIVVFSNKVAKVDQDTIVTELKKLFTDVSIQKETTSSDFDITITAGQNVK